LIGGSRQTETATLAGPTPPRIIGVVAWWRYLPLYSKETKKHYHYILKKQKSSSFYILKKQKSSSLPTQSILKKCKKVLICVRER